MLVCKQDCDFSPLINCNFTSNPSAFIQTASLSLNADALRLCKLPNAIPMTPNATITASQVLSATSKLKKSSSKIRENNDTNHPDI
jgi:hypothetical protein